MNQIALLTGVFFFAQLTWAESSTETAEGYSTLPTLCDELVIERIDSYDWHLHEDDYNDTEIARHHEIDSDLEGLNRYSVLRAYEVRGGYDVGSNGPDNTTYKVSVHEERDDWSFNCEVLEVEILRNPRETDR